MWTDFLVPEEIDGILILPGGKGARRLLWKDERALKLIKKAAENADYCLMIGNGSAILAQTGLLYRRRIADFPMDANWNRMFTAGIERIEGAKVAIDGKFIPAEIQYQVWIQLFGQLQIFWILPQQKR